MSLFGSRNPVLIFYPSLYAIICPLFAPETHFMAGKPVFVRTGSETRFYGFIQVKKNDGKRSGKKGLCHTF
jgi:hypothetical protein